MLGQNEPPEQIQNTLKGKIYTLLELYWKNKQHSFKSFFPYVVHW